MNFWFEMAINAVEVTLILSFLVQYFGYRMACRRNIYGRHSLVCYPSAV